jgi:hypothetical protein
LTLKKFENVAQMNLRVRKMATLEVTIGFRKRIYHFSLSLQNNFSAIADYCRYSWIIFTRLTFTWLPTSWKTFETVAEEMATHEVTFALANFNYLLVAV